MEAFQQKSYFLLCILHGKDVHIQIYTSPIYVLWMCVWSRGRANNHFPDTVSLNQAAGPSPHVSSHPSSLQPWQHTTQLCCAYIQRASALSAQICQQLLRPGLVCGLCYALFYFHGVGWCGVWQAYGERERDLQCADWTQQVQPGVPGRHPQPGASFETHTPGRFQSGGQKDGVNVLNYFCVWCHWFEHVVRPCINWVQLGVTWFCAWGTIMVN